MRKRPVLAGKAAAVLLGGCLLQFGGCNPLTGLLVLAAAPTLSDTFSGLLGGTNTEQPASGQTQP